MRLLTFTPRAGSSRRFGIWVGNRIVDIPRAAEWLQRQGRFTSTATWLTTMKDALTKWESSLSVLKEIEQSCAERDLEGETFRGKAVSYAEDEIEFFAPVPEPPSFRDFYAFEQHVKAARANRGLEMVPEWYEFPVFYFSNTTSFIGHQVPVVKPAHTEELDFELEVACVIGKGGADISVDDAEQYIAGYTILNDWSARDVQRQEMRIGLGPAKGKDFATSVGPCLITPDELEDKKTDKAYDLTMTARRIRNKKPKELSRGNWNSIHYSFAEMIARASQGVVLHPGDVFGSGTVGSGCIMELGPENTDGWVLPGDTIELEIEHLGMLTTPVATP